MSGIVRQRYNDPLKQLLFYWRRFAGQNDSEREYKVKAVELWLYCHEKNHEVPKDVLKVFAEWFRKTNSKYISKYESKTKNGKPSQVAVRASWLDCYDNGKKLSPAEQKIFYKWIKTQLDNHILQHRTGNYYKAFRDYRIFKFVNFMVAWDNISKEKAFGMYADFTERMTLKGKHEKAMSISAIKGAYNRMRKEQEKHGNYLKNLGVWERLLNK